MENHDFEWVNPLFQWLQTGKLLSTHGRPKRWQQLHHQGKRRPTTPTDAPWWSGQSLGDLGTIKALLTWPKLRLWRC